MKTLINLISGQTIPNLIAQKYIKPDKTILLYSKGSIKQKDNYKNVITQSDIEEYQVEAFDFFGISKCIEKIIDQYKRNDIILNFTCGTKIMSLASFEVFRNTGHLSIYIDSENNKIYKYKNNHCESEIIQIKIILITNFFSFLK